MIRKFLFAYCLFVLLFLPQTATADTSESTRRFFLLTGFTPLNVGEFSFTDDNEQAYTPALRAAVGGTVNVGILLRFHLLLGFRLQYLHTMARYSDTFDFNSTDELRGYADILRPGISFGGLWSPHPEHLDLTISALAGPSTAWFEDMSMFGLHLAAEGSAIFWLNRRFGMFVRIALHHDRLWTINTQDWASENMEQASATTLFFSGEIGLTVEI